MKTQRLEARWRTYLLIIPETASPTQIRETRRAFYAGAASMFDLIVSGLDSSSEDPTDADLQNVENLYAELEAHIEQLATGAS